MSDESRVSMSKATEPSLASPPKRPLAVPLATGFATVVLATVIAAWEPWADGPFTAREYHAGGSATFTDSGEGTCVPEDAGKKAQLLGEDKQLLAESRYPASGEILTAGAAAGHCFFYLEFKNVPGDQDAYYVRGGAKFYTEDGKVHDPALSKEDLTMGVAETRERFENVEAPSD